MKTIEFENDVIIKKDKLLEKRENQLILSVKA
jgi:hypothetical protein